MSQCCIRALGERTRSAGPSPLSRGANPPAPCWTAFCRETLGGRLGGARPVWAPPPGSLGKGRDLPIPASGATRPGAVARGPSRAPASRRRGSRRSSKGNGDRAPAFSRLNFLFSRWEREGAATPSPGPFALPCGGSPSFTAPWGGVHLAGASSLWPFRPLWMPRGRRGDEKMDSVGASGLGARVPVNSPPETSASMTFSRLVSSFALKVRFSSLPDGAEG